MDDPGDYRPISMIERSFAPASAGLAQPVDSLSDDELWIRVKARDKSADGLFWYSVVTTGVFCRPSCPSRLARRQNLTFHRTLEAAKATGHRPCRRCRPDEPQAWRRHLDLVARACDLIDKGEVQPGLKEIAAAVGLSPHYFHRIFRETTGVTLKTYSSGKRRARVRSALASGCSITEAIYGAGFNSSGRFYEASKDMLGMTPTKFRDGAAGEEIRVAVAETLIGSVLVALGERGLTSVLSGPDPRELLGRLQDQFPNAHLVHCDDTHSRQLQQTVDHIHATQVGVGLPEELRETTLKQRLWQALKDLEARCPVAYSDLLERAGVAPRATRE